MVLTTRRTAHLDRTPRRSSRRSTAKAALNPASFFKSRSGCSLQFYMTKSRRVCHHADRGQRHCGRRDDWRQENSGYRVQQVEFPSENRCAQNASLYEDSVPSVSGVTPFGEPPRTETTSAALLRRSRPPAGLPSQYPPLRRIGHASRACEPSVVCCRRAVPRAYLGA
jgi:hypothetical protein